jgi:hypothetical protein
VSRSTSDVCDVGLRTVQRIVNEGKFVLNTREYMNFESQSKTHHLVENVTFIDDSDKHEGYSESKQLM